MAKKRSGDLQAPPIAAADAAVFRAAVSDVKPLVHTPKATGFNTPKPRRRLRPAAGEAGSDVDELMPLVSASASDEAALGNATLSYQRAGVRTQVMRRLRRGLYPADDELDLHGLNQSAARDQLAEFLARNRDSGSRCVRIIHGKGYRSGARGPVLKTAVNLWLRRHTEVMAFASARAIDGGTGAVYVLLRA
jgi:DNA-nicking Smr family endonuclease